MLQESIWYRLGCRIQSIFKTYLQALITVKTCNKSKTKLLIGQIGIVDFISKSSKTSGIAKKSFKNKA